MDPNGFVEEKTFNLQKHLICPSISDLISVYLYTPPLFRFKIPLFNRAPWRLHARKSRASPRSPRRAPTSKAHWMEKKETKWKGWMVWRCLENWKVELRSESWKVGRCWKGIYMYLSNGWKNKWLKGWLVGKLQLRFIHFSLLARSMFLEEPRFANCSNSMRSKKLISLVKIVGLIN